MNGKVTDAAVEAGVSGFYGDVARTFIGDKKVAAKKMRAALEAALPHLQPAKREAVRLRDELRERAELESAAREVMTLIRSIPESELLALDADKHPPSSLSEAANTLQAALVATGKQQVREVQGDSRERNGWRKMQKSGASQTRKDGVGACDALYELAVKSGASDTEAAGFSHHVNGALALLECQVHDGLHRESAMEAALAARQPVGQDHLREAIATVCEGWTLPADARKILEKAMWEYAPPAQAVDLGQAIEQIAQQWDGCSYDAVGETIEIGRAIRAAGKRLADSKGAQS